MAKKINPSRRVLYFRKGGAAEDAARLVLQVEHEKSASRERESTATKDGAVPGSAQLEEEVSINALIAEENPTFTMIEDSTYGTDAEPDGYWLEMWEVNLDDKKDDGSGTTTYGAEYRQGYMTEWTATMPTGEDDPEAEGTFMTYDRRKRGRATLTPNQIQELSYVFHDVTKDDPATDGLAAGNTP